MYKAARDCIDKNMFSLKNLLKFWPDAKLDKKENGAVAKARLNDSSINLRYQHSDLQSVIMYVVQSAAHILIKCLLVKMRMC